MRMTFTHLTGSLRGKTQQCEVDGMTFGTGEGCGVRFDAARDSGVLPAHAVLTVEHDVPVLHDRTGHRQVLVNGLRQTEAALRDGDLIQFGDGGPEVRFRLISDGGPPGKSLKTIVADSRDIVVRSPHPHYLSAFYLARHIMGDILVHASPLVKTAAGLVVIIPLLLVAWLGIEVYRQHESAERAQRRMGELLTQLESGRLSRVQLEQRIEQERVAAAGVQRRREEEIAALTAKLRALTITRESDREMQMVRRQLDAIRQAQGFAEDIVRRFGGSIGFLQIGIGFREKATGRPLRYQGLDQLGNPYVDKDGNALVTLEGTAPRVLLYFAGTAFVVDSAGTVVTNRHTVQIWESYEPARQAVAAGFEPDTTLLRLFLPDEERPYTLTVTTVSDRADVAVLRTDRAPAGAPVVLAGDQPPLHVGEPVVMLSYPGSADVLLARATPPVSREIFAKAGVDPVQLVDEAARQKLIRPLVTQGHISDISPDLITYEAVSASGSSGAPIFNRGGAVIGINHATLQRISGVHVAVPIRFVTDMLNLGAQAAPKGK